MAKKKPPQDDPVPNTQAPKQPRGSRHKPRKMVALPPRLYDQLALLAEQNNRPLNWQLRMIVQDALALAGLWPPAPSSD